MRFIFNPDAEEFIPKAEEEHRHSGERYGYSAAESAMGTVWREERLDIAWVSQHPDSEDESVGVGVGWTAEPSHRKSRHVPG